MPLPCVARGVVCSSNCPGSIYTITSGKDYVPEPFDSEKLPVTLKSEIQRFLRVANLIDAQEPRVGCLCRFHAFVVAHDLDCNSNGRGVRQFKTALLQRLKQLPLTRAKSPNLTRRKSCGDTTHSTVDEKALCSKVRHSLGSYKPTSSPIKQSQGRARAATSTGSANPRTEPSNQPLKHPNFRILKCSSRRTRKSLLSCQDSGGYNLHLSEKSHEPTPVNFHQVR